MFAANANAAARAAPAPPRPTEPQMKELPSKAGREATLLEEFTRVPILTRAVVRADARGDVHLTVTTAQHNLPANNKRQTVRTAVVPAAAVPCAPAGGDGGGVGGDAHPSLAAAAIVSPLPTEPAPSALTSVSPSGRRMLVARAHAGAGNGDGGGGGGGVLLELWEGGRLCRELLAPRALHGPIINDGWFSRGAAWSPDESRVCYVAEAPPTQRTPQWGAGGVLDHGRGGGGGGAQEGPEGQDGGGGGAAAKNNAPAAAGATLSRGWRGVGEADEDWGELNTGKRPPALFVLDSRDWSVAPLAGVTPGPDASERHSCGLPAWAPCGGGVVFVAWPHAPPNFPATKRRLGVVFCYNRPCALYYAALPERAAAAEGPAAADAAAAAAAAAAAPAAAPAATTTTAGADAAAAADAATAVRVSPAGLLSAAAPLFTPDGTRLLFFSHEAAAYSGVHNATTALHSMAWEGPARAAAAAAAATPAPPPLVPVVRRPASPGAFPGLYPSLPVDNPFVERGAGRQPLLLLTTQWGSMTAIAAVDLDSGAVTAVSGLCPGGERGAGAGATAGATAGDPADGSWAFQGVAGGVAAALHSSPSRPPRLMLARAGPDPAAARGGRSGGPHWRWREVPALSPDLSALPRVAAALAGLTTGVARLAPRTGDAGLPVETIVTGPRRAFVARGGGAGGAAAAGEAGNDGASATTATTATTAPDDAHGGGGAVPAPPILFPHGGPHAATPSAYYMPAAFFASMGYLFLAVNYRGSVGFGEDAVQSLPGRVGEQDVADCLEALEAVCGGGGGGENGSGGGENGSGGGGENESAGARGDAARCAVIGGSHGGFLAGHLIGQHPSRFRAAGLRNPVLNVALMVGVTDIPDWCYVEAFGARRRPGDEQGTGGDGGGGGAPAGDSGGGAPTGGPGEGSRRGLSGLDRYTPTPTPADLAAFFAKSPAAYLDRVVTPVAMLLGAKDRRVPAEDGRRYLAALRARGGGAEAGGGGGGKDGPVPPPPPPPTRLLVFPEDTHALDRPQTEFEQWVSLAAWLREHGCWAGSGLDDEGPEA